MFDEGLPWLFSASLGGEPQTPLLNEPQASKGRLENRKPNQAISRE